MAKSTGLFAGADSSLVTAATRAGMASAPPNYSDTFQNVAMMYDKTMQAKANMWGNIMMAGAKIGKEIKNNIEVDPPEGGEFAEDELIRASNLYKQSMGLMKTDDDQRLFPGSKKSKELRKQADNIRTEIDNWAKTNLPKINEIEKKSHAIVTNHENGGNALTTTGLHAMEAANMLSASRRNKATDYGNYYKSEIIDGKRVLVAYHDPKKIKNQDVIEGMPYVGTSTGVSIDKDGRVLDANNNPITTTIPEILSNLHLNPVDKNGQDLVKAGKNNTAKFIQDIGFKSTTEWGVNQYQMNQINDLITTESKDRKNWFTPGYGDENGRSFYNRITNADGQGASTISVKLFNSLAEITRADKTKKGVKAEGVFAGLDDGGDGYVTQQEFQTTENMKRIGLALFETRNPNYKKEVTEALYKIDQFTQYEGLFNDGHGRRPDDSGLFASIHPQGGLNLGGIQKVNKGGLNTIRNSIIAGKPFNIGTVAFDPDRKGGWIKTEGETKTPYANTAELVGSLTTHQDFQNLPQYEGKGVTLSPRDKEQIAKIFDSGQTEKYAVAQLNNMFGGGFTEENMWDQYTIGYGPNTYNLKNADDKEKLIKAIEAQLLIDGK